MKKIILLATVLFLCSINFINAQALTVSVTPSICFDPNSPSSNTVLANTSTTLSNVTAYNWSITPWNSTNGCNATYTLTNSSGTAAAISFPCDYFYVITVTAMNGTTALASSNATVTVVGGIFLDAYTTGSTCNGGSVTLWANNGSGHTWYGPNGAIATSASVIVSPTVNTCYTVTGQALGCTVSAVKCLTVSNSPTITAGVVYSGTNHCLYTPVTFTASGATNYDWYAFNNYYLGSGNTLNYYLYNVCFTVVASNGGCTTSAVVCPTATPSSPINITVSPSPTICIGTTATLSTSGASNYSWTSYWQNMNSTSPTVAVTPTAIGYNGYTVSAIDTNGCSTWTHVGITTITGPTVGVSGSATICIGQSRTLTVNGPGPYSWFDGTNTISTASSVVVSPTVSTCYTVTNGNSGCNSAVKCIYITSAPAITLQGGTSCSNWGTSITAQGGNYYSWSIGTASNNNIWVTPQVTTCYTVTGYLSAGCSGTAAACVTVVPGPSFTNNPPSHNVCAGSSVTLANLSYYSTYQIQQPSNWNTTSPQNGTTVAFTPTASGVYSVIVTNTSTPYCYTTFTTYISYNQPPFITVSGSNFCLGSSATLNAFGANSYTWSNGATGSQISVSPTSNTCYTVTGTSAAGCINTAVKCVTVNPVPVITTSGNTTVCAGNSVLLTASGGNSYVWSNNVSGATNNVSPSANTCYTVVGTSLGCTNSAVHCVSPQSANIGVSANSATVCSGSSTNFTATGGVTYTWSTGSANSTVNILPSASGSYTLWGTNANGCVGSQVISLTVDATCTDVWPGDANSDGVVGTTDVLEIGLAFSSTGSARNNASNNYVAQKATNWSGTVSSGKNMAHADCDGSGTVTLADTFAIFNNFGLTHSFRSSTSHSDIADVMLVSTDHYLINAGMWNKLDIMLGDEFNIINAYGIVFEIDFDESLVESNSAYIVYNPSFLNANNQQVEFRKSFFSDGKVYAASVRTDKSDVIGNGKIGEFYFLAKTDLPENTVMNVSVNNAGKVTANRVKAELSGNQAQLTMNSNPVGVKKSDGVSKCGFYPNPASNSIILKSAETSVTNFSITDITGRQIMKGEFTRSLNLNTSELQNGTYFISFLTERTVTTEKMIIQR